jgi:hypothetical protein
MLELVLERSFVKAKKRFSAEQIVALLRQIEAATAQGEIDFACVPGSRDFGSELFPMA